MSIAKMSRMSALGLKSNLIDVLSLLSNYGVLQIEDNAKLNKQFRNLGKSSLSSNNEESNNIRYLKNLQAGLSESGLLESGNNLPLQNSDPVNIVNWSQFGPRSTEVGAENVKQYFHESMYTFALSDAKVIDASSLKQTSEHDMYIARAKDFNAELELEPLSILLGNYINLLDEMIPEAKKYAEVKSGLFRVRTEVSVEDYLRVACEQEDIIAKAVNLFRSIDKLEDHKQKIKNLRESLSELKLEEELLDEKLGESNRELAKKENVEKLVSKLETSVQESEKTAKVQLPDDISRLKYLDEDKDEIEDSIYANKETLLELEDNLGLLKLEVAETSKDFKDFEVLHDFYQVQAKKLEAMKNFKFSDFLFGFGAYIPTALAETVKEDLESKYAIVVDIEACEATEDVPIILQNNPISRPVQSSIDMYALPKPGIDVDPTFWTSIFYYILFGMNLGDVGYGLLLAVACAVGVYVFKAEGNSKKTMQTLMYSGIASVPFGFMFGGFFGDLLSTVSSGAIEFKPLLFNPLEKPIEMLIFSMGVGLLHLFVGMGIDIYIKTKRGNWKAGFFGVAPWYFIVSGIILMLAGQSWALWLIVAGFTVLLLLGDQSTKNPIKRIFSGLASVADLTSWLSDLLSYSRILALALSTSVISMVVNILAMLVGFKGLAFIPFIIIMVFGHILDLALSALSSYVHTTRLQYVEFFGKFYEGGGRKFEPLDYASKYTRVIGLEDRQEKIKDGEFKRIPADFYKIRSSAK